jgi:hypothetical protein
MRDNVKKFVETFSKAIDAPGPIYEFGSLQVDGQIGYADLRPFFPGKKYVGADFRMGPGVDVVKDIENMQLEPGSVGTMLIVDTLEHVRRPHVALDEAWKALGPDGVVVITSHQNFPVHGHPYDYWRYTTMGFDVLLEKFPARIVGSQGAPLNPHTVLGVGFKDAKSPNVAKVLSALKAVELGAQDQKRRGLKRRIKKKIRGAMAQIKDARAQELVSWELRGTAP